MSVEMRGLLARVEAAKGPDRELDAHIATRLAGFSALDGFGFFRECPTYTASIDAAVALVGKVLPGAEWLKKDAKAATVYQPPAEDKAWAVHHHGLGANFALSLIAALLRALLAQAEQEVAK